MTNFLASWVVLQLIVIGLVGGQITRNCLRGEVAVIEKEITFAHYWTPVVFPLVVFTNPDSTKCNLIK
jgi:hypothetical protein